MISKRSGDMNGSHTKDGNAFSGGRLEAGMIPGAHDQEVLFASFKIWDLELIEMNRKLFAVSNGYFSNNEWNFLDI